MAAMPSVAGATIIEFENIAPARGQTLIGTSYSELGYEFTTTAADLGIFDSASTNAAIPDSGTDSLTVNGGTNVSLTMTSQGGPFDVLSALVSEGRNVGSGFERFAAISLTFTGQFAMGGTVMQTFDMDQLASDQDPSAFELVSLSGFTSLSSLTIQAFGSLEPGQGREGYSFGIDSIVTAASAVPVPAAALLFGPALAALRRRARRS